MIMVEVLRLATLVAFGRLFTATERREFASAVHTGAVGCCYVHHFGITSSALSSSSELSERQPRAKVLPLPGGNNTGESGARVPPKGETQQKRRRRKRKSSTKREVPTE